jgi:hypothetical protein
MIQFNLRTMTEFSLVRLIPVLVKKKSFSLRSHAQWQMVDFVPSKVAVCKDAILRA